jgi:hypothetical protein
MTKELTTITLGDEHNNFAVALSDAGIENDVAKIAKWLTAHDRDRPAQKRALLARVLACDALDDAELAKSGLAIVAYMEGWKGSDIITYADAEAAKAAGVETFSAATMVEQLKGWNMARFGKPGYEGR